MNSAALSDLRAEYQTLAATHQLFTVLGGGTSRILNDMAAELGRVELAITTATEQSAEVQPQPVISMLSRIRQGLGLFDQHLPAANLRRHFEQYGKVGSERLEWVLRFYLGKPVKTTADRDKVDLIVTRWGQTDEPSIDEVVYQHRTADLTGRLTEIYRQLGIVYESLNGETAAITRLNQERQALLGIQSLRELIDRQVLLRVRKIKDEMDELFFRPAILAEVVEVNLSLHRVFQQLLRAEQGHQSVSAEPVTSVTSVKLESHLDREVEQLAVSLSTMSNLLVGSMVSEVSLTANELSTDQLFTSETKEKVENLEIGKTIATADNQDVVVALAQVGQTLAELALQVQSLVLRLTEERSKLSTKRSG